MAIRFTSLAGAAIAAGLLVASTASAQEQRPRHAKAAASNRQVLLAEIKAPPLTVQKRSFLDPGNVVPVGSATPEYITANTTEHVQIYRSFSPAFYGESALPGRFDLPNNPRFEGATPQGFGDLIP